jgi:hypothetical protein
LNIDFPSMIKISILLLTLIFPSLVYPNEHGCSDRDKEFSNRSSAPEKLWVLIKKAGIQEDYTLGICGLNPWYLTGDFNNNGQYDFALLLRQRSKENETRLAVIWDTGKVVFLDRDKKLQYPSIEAWHIYPKCEKVLLGAEEGTPPILEGDGIMIYKLESSSSLVYWNGTRFTYYWQGD